MGAASFPVRTVNPSRLRAPWWQGFRKDPFGDPYTMVAASGKVMALGRSGTAPIGEGPGHSGPRDSRKGIPLRESLGSRDVNPLGAWLTFRIGVRQVPVWRVSREPFICYRSSESICCDCIALAHS